MHLCLLSKSEAPLPFCLYLHRRGFILPVKSLLLYIIIFISPSSTTFTIIQGIAMHLLSYASALVVVLLGAKE